MTAKKQAIAAAIDKLCAHWPACFSATKRRPLAIGIHTGIIAAGVLDPAMCSLALRAYTASKGYLSASTVPDAVRIGLDGEPSGIVSEAEAAVASKRLVAVLAKQRRRREAREAEAKAARPVVVMEAPREPGRKPLLRLKRKAA